MTMNRSLSLFSLALPLLLGAAKLPAQNRQLFTWRGHVDREVQITMRGRDVWTSGVDGNDRISRVRVASALPQTEGYVRVESNDRRGDVSVIQQPSARNGYTAVVRVRDRARGADNYRLVAYWESRYADNRGRGRGGYGDDQDGDWRHDRDGQPRIESRDRNGDWGTGSGTALRWTGNVDNEIEIRVQGRRMDERTLSGAAPTNQRSTVVSGIPRDDVQLMIAQRAGRGTVYVAQQPSAYNGYTAVIRVKDPQGGYGYYDFDVGYRR